MKKLKVVIAAILLFLINLSSNVEAQDIYVPFSNSNNVSVEDEEINIQDLNLKQSLLDYYKFHIDKNYNDNKITKNMMEKFTSLSLPWANIFSLQGLEYAKNLKTLNLDNNFIENIDIINSLENLEELNVGNNKIKSINNLSNLKKLKKLNVHKNLINSLDFLNDINVENLDISGNAVLKNYVTKYLRLDNLKSLNISSIGLNNIDFIKNATNLENLIAEENSIKDISVLKNLKNLRILYLDKNDISDIISLENLDKLEELLLYKNNISNIDALANKKYLYRLQLNDNIGIKNISSLRTVINLASLDISNTNISDISSLNELKYIYYLALSQTKISNEEIIKFEKENYKIKKENNIDKKIQIIQSEASKYFSLKNYLFMFIIIIIIMSGIYSYWRKSND